MDDRFRLVFRGELLEGQHRAVVKRRLAERLKLDDAQVDKLFSGDPVIVKRDADKATAARYQAVFKQAGGLLRVQALDGQPVTSEKPANLTRTDVPGGDPDGPAAPARSESTKARPAANPEVEAPAFTVQNAYSPPPAEPAGEIEAPEFGVLAVGARLSDPRQEAPVVVEVDFELADVGADLLEVPRQVAAVALGPLDFEVADVGADLGPGPSAVTVTAPDVSHLTLVEA